MTQQPQTTPEDLTPPKGWRLGECKEDDGIYCAEVWRGTSGVCGEDKNPLNAYRKAISTAKKKVP